MTPSDSEPLPFLTRVQIENYRSIATCDVRLGPLTVLAGPNAAGKSNFLDAIRFVRDALHSSPAQALESRGGLEEVLHRGTPGERADLFRIRLEARVPSTEERPPFAAVYVLEVGANPETGDPVPVLRREETFIDGSARGNHFTPELAQGHPIGWRDDILLPRNAQEDLPTRELYTRLSAMRFYELLTPVLRAIDDTPSRRGSGIVLGEQGEHLARVLEALAHEHPWMKETLDGYLATMIDNAVGLDGISVEGAGLAYVVGRFRAEGGQVANVDRRSLSDGTLRLAGVLAALFQPQAFKGLIPFVGIEEPEISLHPPMLGALYDALIAASHNTQVLVTTQSADLLDNAAVDPAHLLVARDGGSGTQLGPLDAAGRRLLADGVLTLPELLRSGEMRPAPATASADGWEDAR